MNMKLTKLCVFLLSVGILFSCSKEELTIEEASTIESADLVTNLGTYADSSLGMYKGVFSTADSQDRGTVEIKVINELTAKASITYLNGDVEFFNGNIRQQNGLTSHTGMDVMFNSGASSFAFSVHADGSNPTITEASSNARASLMTVVKENTRGAVVPITGTFTSELGNSGTWNLIFNSGNGEGDDTDITSQTIVSGVDYGSMTGNTQDGCTPLVGEDVTLCDIGGSYTSLGVDIVWAGSHGYFTVGDCSQVTGTWTATGDVAVSSGTFTSDTTCAPANDLCDNATPIACGDSTFTGNTTLATTIGFPNQDCVGAEATDAPGVWFVYTGTSEGNTVTVSTFGTDFDTQLFVYTGSCSALQCFAGNDDAVDLDSAVSFEEENGVNYYIYLTGFDGEEFGDYVFNISCAIVGETTNDLCGDALPIACGESDSGSTLDATTTGFPNEDCGDAGTTDAGGVWYVYTGASEGTEISVDTFGSGFDTQLFVYTGACEGLVCLDGNDDEDFGDSLQSQVFFNESLGQDYYIYVTGFDEFESGLYAINVTCAPTRSNNMIETVEKRKVHIVTDQYGNQRKVKEKRKK